MHPFRPDLEGLRAVAVGAVLLCHARLGFARGGFVGVDVFFVISGFLITQLLIGAGGASLARFYARRVKRLMPQAVTVIVFVAIASWLVLSPLRAAAVAGDVTAAGLYGMNWRLAGASVDYFSTATDGPLDHFWSLAVEEQFYAVWPLLLLLIAARARVLVVAVLTCASFAYAVHLTRVAPELAYFSAFARAWELGVGALLAILGWRGPAWLAWPGLAGIVVAVVGFGPDTAVPGVAALVPVLGTAAVIAAAGGNGLLSRRPVQAVGRRSYALYIWHWPVLVLAGSAWGPLSPAQALAAVLASAIPALVAFRWIEEPMRRSKLHVRRPVATLAVAVAGSALAVLSGLMLADTLSSPPALASSQAEGAPQLRRTGRLQASAAALRPRPADASADRGRVYRDGCLAGEHEVVSRSCVYGRPGGRRTMVLFGDSHAMQWFPALQQVARRRGWRLVVLTKAGCPPPEVRVVFTLSGRSYAECDAWRSYALRRIERTERPALVVAGASAHYTVVRDGGRRVGGAAGTRLLADGFAPVLGRLRATGSRVAVIGDAPRPPRDIPDCVSGHMDRLARCAFPRAAATEGAGVLAAGAARVGGVRVIDPTDAFCLRDVCPAVIGDVLVYRNSGHLTASYVSTLAGWLGRRLR
jgi:peptidoglycan/LPS O-acetylase OafA/YrhL